MKQVFDGHDNHISIYSGDRDGVCNQFYLFLFYFFILHEQPITYYY